MAPKQGVRVNHRGGSFPFGALVASPPPRDYGVLGPARPRGSVPYVHTSQLRCRMAWASSYYYYQSTTTH